MIIGVGILHLNADLQDGEASPAAGAGKVSFGGHILRSGSVCEMTQMTQLMAIDTDFSNESSNI